MSILNTLNELEKEYQNNVIKTVKEHLLQFCLLLKQEGVDKNNLYFDFAYDDHYNCVIFRENVIFSKDKYDDIDLDDEESYSTEYHGYSYADKHLNEQEQLILKELVNQQIFEMIEQITDIIKFDEDGYIEVTSNGVFFKIK